MPSRVWFTLSHGSLTEVFDPRLDTPSVRDLELVVRDGRRVERETTATTSVVQRVEGAGLTFRQVDTARSGRYRITKTYVTDPGRAVVLANVRVESLAGQRLQVWVRYDPALRNDGDHDRGRTSGSVVLTRGGGIASALATVPALRSSSSGYLGTRSDPWRDLRANGRLDRRFSSAPRPGNVVQLARLPLTGLRGAQRLTMALAFAQTESRARGFASIALQSGFASPARSYAEGWQGYPGSLKPPPASVASDPALRAEYDTSLMVMRASEDKTFPGASIASPTMPWHWGDHSIEKGPSAAYHLVWSRDLYQVATAQLAAGDSASASRELDFLLFRQQKPDGSVPQNSFVDGREKWTSTQMDEVAFPIVLAWQLGRSDARTYARREAGGGLHRAPRGAHEAGAVGEPVGVVAGDDRLGDRRARVRGRPRDPGRRRRRRRAVPRRRGPVGGGRPGMDRDVERPVHAAPVLPAPDEGPRARSGDEVRHGRQRAFGGGPARRRRPEFFEPAPRREAPRRPVIANTVSVVDKVLGVQTPTARGSAYARWRRDAAGAGGMAIRTKTFGRVWPTRGRAARRAVGARRRLAWPASRRSPRRRWRWSHAVFVRLAWSIDAGRPVERPSVVACRYTGVCVP